MHKLVSDTLKRLTVGEAVSFKNLTMFPLLDGSSGEADYLLLEEALQAGYVTVKEVHESGSVNSLRVINRAKQAVLIMDGEELVGAKQNRVVNLTILVPAEQEVVIPVSCVEQGRWHHVSAEFRVSRQSMPSTMRAYKSAQVHRARQATGAFLADQGAIWRMIDEREELLDTFSPTSAMADLYERHEVTLRDYERAIEPQRGQVGALFAVNGAIASMDVFDFSRTMHSLFAKLLRGVAMDAISFFRLDFAPITLDTARMFVQRIAEADSEVFPSVGEGEDVRFRAAGVVGSALVARERMVHLCAFSIPDDRTPEQRDLFTRLSRASTRSSRWL